MIHKLFLIFVLFGPISCANFKEYGPQSKRENIFFSLTSRSIYPKEIRKNIGIYKDILLNWPGVIQEIKEEHSELNVIRTYLVKHHYWNFKEDLGKHEEALFISPKGEGNFQFKAVYEKGAERNFPVLSKGDFVLFYGVVDSIQKNKTINMRMGHFLGAKSNKISLEKLNYERIVHLEKNAPQKYKIIYNEDGSVTPELL